MIMGDYRDILKAAGHDTEGILCHRCMAAAKVRTHYQGGDLIENYRDLVKESKANAMLKHAGMRHV